MGKEKRQGGTDDTNIDWKGGGGGGWKKKTRGEGGGGMQNAIHQGKEKGKKSPYIDLGQRGGPAKQLREPEGEEGKEGQGGKFWGSTKGGVGAEIVS